MSRILVYLDQSVLSNIAKDPSKPVHKELLELVKLDGVIFPYSWTHHYEAELDDRLAEAIQDVGASLSKGVEFRPTIDIVAAQAGDAFERFSDREQRKRVDWFVFDHDPQGDLPPEIANRKRRGGVYTSEEGKAERRERKREFARSLARTRAERSDPVTFDQARIHYRDEALEFYFRAPYRSVFRGSLPRFPESVMLNYAGRAADLAFGLDVPPEEQLAGMLSFAWFLTSDELATIPFVQLESSILASIEVDEPTRNYSPGDFYDLETWATYLPFVDVVVADQNMTEVLRRRGLAGDFDCRVLPGSDDGLDSLVDLLRWHAAA